MLKLSAAGALALCMMMCTVAFAQSPPLTPSPAGRQQAALAPPPPQWSAEDRAAFTDARIASLKAGLALRPDQQKAWDGFEKALREVTKQQSDRIAQARSASAPTNVVESMRRRADAMTAAAASLKQLADATEPLYRGLDDNQKRRLVALVTPPRR